MKKTHKAVLSILLVLTLLTALPLTALAMDDNSGSIGSVPAGETMTNNTGSIGTNNGTITNNGVKPAEGQPADLNSGKIETNLGKVDTNYGTIDYVPNGYARGFVGDNQGYIGAVPGGTVDKNNGTIGDVAGSGTVNTNNNTIGNVCSGGIVGKNDGTIGTVTMGGTVGENNKDINSNAGTVTTNNINGTVTNTYSTNNNNEIIGEGSVVTNYGTVTKTDGKTYYGLQTVNDDNSEGTLRDVEADQTVNLLDIKREGYKLIGYSAMYGGSAGHSYEYTETPVVNNVDEAKEETYTYKVEAPNRLKLFWEKIASVFTPDSSSGGGEVVELSAKKNYIGIGSVIYINEKGYKVVEIKDDAYVVVSFDALSDEDVKDLDALFAKLFTADQQKQIKNVGQLLDAEDVLAIFGKPGNHPVFEVNKSLVQ